MYFVRNQEVTISLPTKDGDGLPDQLTETAPSLKGNVSMCVLKSLEVRVLFHYSVHIPWMLTII